MAMQGEAYTALGNENLSRGNWGTCGIMTSLGSFPVSSGESQTEVPTLCMVNVALGILPGSHHRLVPSSGPSHVQASPVLHRVISVVGL